MSKKPQLRQKIIKHKQYLIPLIAVVIILAVVLGVNIYKKYQLNQARKDIDIVKQELTKLGITTQDESGCAKDQAKFDTGATNCSVGIMGTIDGSREVILSKLNTLHGKIDQEHFTLVVDWSDQFKNLKQLIYKNKKSGLNCYSRTEINTDVTGKKDLGGAKYQFYCIQKQ